MMTKQVRPWTEKPAKTPAHLARHCDWDLSSEIHQGPGAWPRSESGYMAAIEPCFNIMKTMLGNPRATI